MLIRADARALPLRDACVQCVVTSPPYWGLRDYGLAPRIWGGQESCDHRWGDTISVNATNHTGKAQWNHTRNGRDEEQPIEKRVSWLRTVVDQGNVCGLCGAWRGDLGLEPTPELYVEHLVGVFREVWRVLQDDGTLWLNLGDSYAGSASQGGPSEKRQSNKGSWHDHQRLVPIGLKPKDLVGIPWRVAFALQAAGWYLRSDIIWHKPNPMPESVTDRPTKSHEYLFLLSKSERYVYDAAAIAEPLAASTLEWATGKRGWGPSSLSHKTPGGLHGPSLRGEGRCGENEARNKRSVWTVNTEPYAGAHFATMPEALIEPCILAGCPVGGLVLDPFIGSGTVGAVAERLGRRWVGTDLGYQPLAQERTAQRGLRW